MMKYRRYSIVEAFDNKLDGMYVHANGLMATAVTYAYYRDEYSGELPVEAFTAAFPAAIRHLIWLTGGASIDEETQPDALTAYKRALPARPSQSFRGIRRRTGRQLLHRRLQGFPVRE